MKEVILHNYWLPRSSERPPYLSSWKMTAEEAARLGALREEPTSREVRLVADSAAERNLIWLSTDTSPGAVGRATRAHAVKIVELPVRSARWLEDLDRPWRAN